MRISKALTITTAVAFSAAMLFSKPVMAERAMLQLKAAPDSAAIANFRKECPNLAKWLPEGPAREKAIELAAARKGIRYAPGAEKQLAANAREENVKAPEMTGSNDAAASAINALSDQVNKYADLTPAERQKLGEDIAKSGDADLIAAYADAKAKGGSAPDAQPSSASSGTLENAAKTAADAIVETGTVAAKTGTDAPKAIATPAAEEKINELYNSINKYADLTGAEQEALGKAVAETENAELAGAYDEAKANYKAKEQPKAPAKPAVNEQPVEIENAIPEPEPKQVAAEKQAKQPAPEGTLPPQPAKVEKKAEPAPVMAKEAEGAPTVKEAASKNLAPLKDSLNRAINECYEAINAMAPETYGADSARIAGAMGKIRGIMDRGFPKGDNWVGYTWKNLSEYFVQTCEAMQPRKN
ncbi:MAG: hypothetical protein WC263_02065 [Candidatus Micrarchaeia archaeon]|jgi:hypothetical protein